MPLCAGELQVIWPPASSRRYADPWSNEERRLMADPDTAKAIAHAAKAGARLSLKRADGSWFTVVDFGRMCSAPIEFNLKRRNAADFAKMKVGKT